MSKILPKIAALGYYGFNNLGDEAVLAGIRAALGETLPSHEMLVLSNNPTQTRALHKGTNAVNRWEWRTTWAALKNTDVFILGGGSLLQDATSSRSVLWYALMALMARRRARRVVWWGQGIGPLNAPSSRRLVRLIADQADALTVRDEKSANLLKEIGVRGSIQTVADPAFALSPDLRPDLGAAAPALLALRAWKNDILGASMTPADWEKLAAQTGGLRLVPMHLPEDAEYAQTLSWGTSKMPTLDWQAENAERKGISGVLGEFANAPLVIAQRLHALLFAARCGVPFVALSYDPKVAALARAARQDDALIDLENFSAPVLHETVARVWDTRKVRAAHLTEWANEESRRARLPAAIVRDLV